MKFQYNDQMTDLMKAVKSGCIADINKHLSQSRQQTPKEKNTALMYACYYNKPNCIPLLKNEAKLKNVNGLSALMVACQQNNVECAQQLKHLEQKMKSRDYKAALIHSVLNNSFECAQILLEECQQKDWHGFTALHYAAMLNKPKFYELLAQKEGGYCTENYKSVLEIAFESNSVEFIQQMVQKSNKYLLKDQYCLTYSFRTSTEWMFNEIVGKKSQYKDRTNRTALMLSCLYGNAKFAIMRLHEAKKQDDSGKTALIYAVWSKSIDCIKLLIKHEANMRDNYGYTALHYTAASGFVEAFELLRYDEENTLTAENCALLMTAAYNNQLEFCKLVIHQAGQKDSSGRTALMKTALVGKIECLQLLAPLEQCMIDNNGCTALMIAIQYNQTNCFQYLQKEFISEQTTALQYFMKESKYIFYSRNDIEVDLSSCECFSNQIGIVVQNNCALDYLLQNVAKQFIPQRISISNLNSIFIYRNVLTCNIIEKMFETEQCYLKHETIKQSICHIADQQIISLLQSTTRVRQIALCYLNKSSITHVLRHVSNQVNDLVVHMFSESVFLDMFKQGAGMGGSGAKSWERWGGE